MSFISDVDNSPIPQKIRSSEIYAQNFYAAMCNVKWRNTLNPKFGLYAVTWRTAGGIVANYRQTQGTYLDWYCSGIGPKLDGEVSEGTVTDEIKQDLLNIGWVIAND